MRNTLNASRVVGALLLGAVLVPLLPQAQQPAAAKQEVGIDPFTVVDRRNDQLHPRLDGDLVVWQDYRDVGSPAGDDLNADIYAARLPDGDEVRVSNTRLSSRPDVSGDLVVYADASNGDADIRLYDLRRDDYTWVVRRSGSAQDRPAIDGNLVVWQDNREGNWDIRGLDLDGEEFWVSRRDGDQTNPRVSGRVVVWQDDRDGCCDIYARDLDSGTVTRVTDDQDAFEPDVSGSWVVYRRGDGDDSSIWAFNLDGGERLRLNTSRGEPRSQPAIDGRLVAWADRRNGEDLNIVGFDLETRTEFLIGRDDDDQLEPAVSGARVVWTDRDGDRGAQIRGANLSLPSGQPTPTPSPTTPPGTACPPAGAAVRDGRYFAQTGYRIDHDVIWSYFVHRGGVKNFGYPVSRTVTFLGMPTQFFQRQVVQVNAGAPQLLNLLDPDLMPATNINFSTYPGVDPNVKAETPPVSDPQYGTKIIDFTRSVAPDTWQGLPVRFFSTFSNQVTLQDAYPNGGGNPSLLPLLNLEMSGAPISRPQADPANANFVYQRFQRTILHHDAATGVTQPILLADYFKDVLRGAAPADLMAQMAGSRFLKQYNPSRSSALNRPQELPDTNLCGAFEPQ